MFYCKRKISDDFQLGLSSSEICSLDLIHKYVLMNQKESLHFLPLKTKQMEISFQYIKNSSSQNLRFVAMSCDMLVPGP